MFELHVPSYELYDEMTDSFIPIDEQQIKLEHSLYALAKWEAKHHKPFLTDDEMTNEEALDYIRCMMIDDVDEDFYRYMPDKVFDKIIEYINDPCTATTINRRFRKSKSRDIITAEIIYYWMISLGIPLECQYWNLNRLLTLIEVCDIKNSPPKKMSKREIRQQYASLNAARRAKLHSKG